MISPDDLLELLKAHDYSNVVNKCQSRVISDDDLKMLLDRSDLMNQESSQKTKNKIQIKSKVFEILESGEGPKGILG